MPLHDATLRTPPFLRIFPDDAARDATLDGIAREVEERGMGDDDPGAFTLLARTRQALSELREPGEGDDGGHTHGILLFHAFHLRNAGETHFLVTVPVCRWAVEGTGGGAREGDGLPDAAYVQLPQHLFWVRESLAERPLSLDGFFWTMRGDALHLLGVVDAQPGTGGIRVLPLPAVPWAEREVWMAETMRDGGDDFRSEIPGSEIEGLYEIRTAGELLKLAARLDHFLARFPDRAVASDGTAEGAAGLPVRRLVLT